MLNDDEKEIPGLQFLIIQLYFIVNELGLELKVATLHGLSAKIVIMTTELVFYKQNTFLTTKRKEFLSSLTSIIYVNYNTIVPTTCSITTPYHQYLHNSHTLCLHAYPVFPSLSYTQYNLEKNF